MNLDLAIEDAVDNALAAFPKAPAVQQDGDDAGASPYSSAPADAPPSSFASSSGPASTSSSPDVALVFISSAFAESYDDVVPQLLRRVPSLRFVYGCSGFGVLGGTACGGPPEEVESAPAFSLTLARLPAATDITLTYLTPDSLPDGDAPPQAWADMLGLRTALPERPLSLVVLADPTFGGGVQDLLAGLDYAFPGASKVGGLSSAGTMSSARTMFCWSRDGSAADPAARSGGRDGDGTRGRSRSRRRTVDGTEPAEASGSSSGSDSEAGSGTEAGAEQEGEGMTIGGQRAQRTGVRSNGAAVLALHGGVTMELVVAQGCRPLTPSVWEVDEVAPNGSRVLSLRSVPPEPAAGAGDGKGGPSVVGRGSGRVNASMAPLQALQQDLMQAASLRGGGGTARDLKELVRNLTLGVAPRSGGLTRPNSSAPQDFLIRAMAFDQTGAMAVGDELRSGQRVRFMVRDRQGAMEDLNSHGMAFKRRELTASMSGTAAPPPFGMLVFSCNGRASALYAESSYDSRTIASYVPVPPAGFLCNGEIGTVGGETRLHGFTCAVGVLRCMPAVAADEDETLFCVD